MPGQMPNLPSIAQRAKEGVGSHSPLRFPSPASRGDMWRAQGKCPTKEGQPWVGDETSIGVPPRGTA